jgi:hypothetical protein
MYQPNKRHQQPLLISNVNDLPAKKRKRLGHSWAEDFYRDFFCRIHEDAFSVLYVDHPSRPNVPVNWLVGLETLKAGFGWKNRLRPALLRKKPRYVILYSQGVDR